MLESLELLFQLGLLGDQRLQFLGDVLRPGVEPVAYGLEGFLLVLDEVIGRLAGHGLQAVRADALNLTRLQKAEEDHLHAGAHLTHFVQE